MTNNLTSVYPALLQRHFSKMLNLIFWNWCIHSFTYNILYIYVPLIFLQYGISFLAHVLFVAINVHTITYLSFVMEFFECTAISSTYKIYALSQNVSHERCRIINAMPRATGTMLLAKIYYTNLSRQLSSFNMFFMISIFFTISLSNTW